MCKSAIVSTELASLSNPDDVTATVYIGDGSNDLCPVLNLDSWDLACPRIPGYSLARKLRNRSDVNCRVLEWINAEVIVEALAKMRKCSKSVNL